MRVSRKREIDCLTDKREYMAKRIVKLSEQELKDDLKDAIENYKFDEDFIFELSCRKEPVDLDIEKPLLFVKQDCCFMQELRRCVNYENGECYYTENRDRINGWERSYFHAIDHENHFYCEPCLDSLTKETIEQICKMEKEALLPVLIKAVKCLD